MEVYVGGRAQGKLDYVRGRYPEKGRIVFGESAGVEDCLGAEIIEHFHLFVKGFGGNSEKAFEAVGRILEGNPQVIILCDEIGCGIVPMEKEEREYRELVGRIMGMVVQPGGTGWSGWSVGSSGVEKGMGRQWAENGCCGGEEENL